MIQAILQTSFSLGGVTLVRANGSSTRFRPAADTDAARGTALTTALAAAITTDSLFIGPGVYDVGNAALNLVRTTTPGVSLIGSGMGVTKIKSAVVLGTSQIVVLGRDSEVANLTIEGNAAADQFQAPVGTVLILGQSDLYTATLRHLRLVADADGLYIAAGYGFILNVYNCLFETKYDAVAIGNTSFVHLHNCDIDVAGPTGTGAGISRGIYASSGWVNMYGGSIAVFGGTTTTNGVRADGGAINLFGTAITPTESGGGTVFDLVRVSGTLGVANLARTDGTSITTSGTITSLGKLN